MGPNETRRKSCQRWGRHQWETVDIRWSSAKHFRQQRLTQRGRGHQKVDQEQRSRSPASLEHEYVSKRRQPKCNVQRFEQYKQQLQQVTAERQGYRVPEYTKYVRPEQSQKFSIRPSHLQRLCQLAAWHSALHQFEVEPQCSPRLFPPQCT